MPACSVAVKEVTCPSFASKPQPTDGFHKADKDAGGVIETSVKILELNIYLATESNVSCRSAGVANSYLL